MILPIGFYPDSPMGNPDAAPTWGGAKHIDLKIPAMHPSIIGGTEAPGNGGKPKTRRINMLKSIFGVFGIIVFAVTAVLVTAPTYAGDEVFVVSSSQSGDTNYLSSNGDGTFGDDPLYEQEILLRAREFDFDVSWDMSFGNGLGDFDGDGDLDFVMGIGFGSGNIFIYEKMGAGNQFAEPYFVGTWGTVEGSYPMDIAVADFDGDERMDFILTLGKSAACELFLNKGTFEFESKLLPDTAPGLSYGVDAADFDNDGDADFVVAAGSNGRFYVNLNDDDLPGNFLTHTFDSDSNGAAIGIAAADFTGDGITDIVAGAPGYLEVYKGDGDGKTFTHFASYAFPINLDSAIDNYDFDHDGDQDLVVANYGDDVSGVAVLLGSGDLNHPDGLFVLDDIYPGGTGSTLNAISGPPYKPVANKEPVAVIEPEYLEITAGEEINFDASNSFDEDGQIVRYEWDFGEAGIAADVGPAALMPQAAFYHRVAGIKSTHTYFNIGRYLVTLWVTDDQGATSQIQAEVLVKPVQVQIKFFPYNLYFGSRARSLWAKIIFPQKYDARNVDDTSVCISPDDASAIFIRPKKKYTFFDKIFDKFRKRKKSTIVRFDRQAVLAKMACPPDKRTELKIRGEIFHNDRWVEFEGTGSVRTKMRKRHKCRASLTTVRPALTSVSSDIPHS